MYNMLKRIMLSVFFVSLSCFLASCDDENNVTFDYQYDSVATTPLPEMDISEARKIQASGKLETVAVTDAVAPVAPSDEPLDSTVEGDDLESEDVESSDPNSL